MNYLILFGCSVLIFNYASKVNLEPFDKRLVKSLKIDDVTEVALIQQELDIDSCIYNYRVNLKSVLKCL